MRTRIAIRQAGNQRFYEVDMPGGSLLFSYETLVGFTTDDLIEGSHIHLRDKVFTSTTESQLTKWRRRTWHDAIPYRRLDLRDFKLAIVDALEIFAREVDVSTRLSHDSQYD